MPKEELVKRYRCQYCNQMFTTEKSCTNHENNCIKNPNIFKCPYCGAKYDDTISHSKHKLICDSNPYRLDFEFVRSRILKVYPEKITDQIFNYENYCDSYDIPEECFTSQELSLLLRTMKYMIENRIT